MFAICTTLLGGLVSMPAPIVVSAEDGWLPAFFSKKRNVYLFFYISSLIPVIFDITFDALVSFVLVPGMILGAVSNIAALNMPKRFPDAWNRCALKCPYPVYLILMCLSIAGSLVTAYFSLAGVDLFTVIGNIAFTIFMFAYATYRFKSGKVELKSIQGLEEIH